MAFVVANVPASNQFSLSLGNSLITSDQANVPVRIVLDGDRHPAFFTELGSAANRKKIAITHGGSQLNVDIKSVVVNQSIFAAVYPSEHTATYVQATSTYSTSFYPHYSTDPNETLTGTWDGNQWLAVSGTTTNQKFIIDYGSAKCFKKMVLENAHNSGSSTTVGIKNFSVYGSNASSFPTADWSDDTGLTLLGTFQAAAHSSSNAADPQEFDLSSNTEAYRYYVLKISDNHGHASWFGFRHVEFEEEQLISSYCCYVTIASYLASSDNELVLHVDSSQDDNSVYVDDSGGPAAQLAWASDMGFAALMAQEPDGTADGIIDSTSNANHGQSTNMAGTELVDDDNSKAISFDGGNDCITFADALAAINGSDCTWEIRVKSSETSNSVPMESEDGNAGLFFQIAAGGLWRFGDAYQTTNISGDGEYHYIVGTYDSSTGAIQIFTDGILEDSATDSPSTMANLVVGSRSGSYAAEIDVSEVRISTVKRSAEWIKLVNASFNDELITWSAYSAATAIRAILDQPYKMADFVRAICDQPYHQTVAYRAAFEMIWSVRMRAVFVMSYSDLPRHRAKFDQVWERFRKLRNQAKFEYGDKDKLVAALDQVYHLMGGVRNKADFAWAVTEKPIRTLFDQVYQIKDKNKQRAVLRQLWIMVMGDAILQKDEVTISARRGDEVRTLNRVYDIDQEEDSTLYYQAGDIKIDKANKQHDGLPNGESEYLFCSHLETEVTISVTGGADKAYLVREPYRDRDAQNGEVFIIPLRSKTILLDEQESDIAQVKESDLIMVHYDGEILTGLSEAEFAALDKSRVTARIDASTAYGMRKSLVELLAYPFSVEWNLPNTYLSANRLQIDTATRMTKIKEIVASLGGIVQSSDDGEELECKKEYKVQLAKLQQYSPEIELTDQEDAFRITQQHQSRPGYNRFLVTDRDISSDDIRTYNEQITAHQQQVQISWVPNTGQRCTLEKSRGNHVWIVNDGPGQEVIEIQIEIVAGVGTTLSRPFYGFEIVNGQKSIVWEDVNLGDLDIDESGVVRSTVPGNTLATIRYWTKYYQFQVHDPRNENAQVWPVIL